MRMKKDTTQNLKDLKCNNESTLVGVNLLMHPNIIQSHLDLQMERSELINMLSIILMSGKEGPLYEIEEEEEHVYIIVNGIRFELFEGEYCWYYIDESGDKHFVAFERK